jgi:repressor of nif and glnA expression
VLLTLTSHKHGPRDTLEQIIFYADLMKIRVALDYNELKLLVLRLLSDQSVRDSATIASGLEASGMRVDVHAIRMALVRYYKEGLLRRQRKAGLYIYEISERGTKRLEWLESVRGQ